MKKVSLLLLFCFIGLSLAWAAPATLSFASAPANPNTYDSALAALQDGNRRFAENKSVHPRLNKEVGDKLSAEGQFPLAAVLACSDSRAPVELIFDMGLGDLFVIRAAGGVAGPDQIGSVEYAVEHFNVPLILVLGHTKCGAVTAAVAGTREDGALGGLLARLKPAAEAVENLDQAHKVGAAVVKAVDLTVEELLSQSQTLKQAVQENRLKIIGGVYNLDTRRVFFRLREN
jgi:carbonic anhydrase